MDFVPRLIASAVAPLALCCAVTWPANAAPHPAHIQVKPLNPKGAQRTGFTRMPARSLGIHWTNSIPIEQYSVRQNLMNGSGIALGDFDGDGWCDIYFCNRSGSNALYRNRGDWRFEDVTASAGVACADQISSGAVFADANGDGRLDLLVSSFAGPGALFLNLGGGAFTNVTSTWGFRSDKGGTSMALGDLDGDRHLDLYLCNFSIEALLRDGTAISTRMVRGQPVVAGRFAKRLKIIDGLLVEFGEPDSLFWNRGDRFEDAPWSRVLPKGSRHPARVPNDFGLAVQIRDIDEDGFPDIYLCNDFQTPDRLWLNQGNGTFRPPPPFAIRNMSYASMGVDFADIDRDGHLDFITVEMLSRAHDRHLQQSSPRGAANRIPGLGEAAEDVARNALFWNRGDGTYAEIAWFSGVAASDWSWTVLFLDADLDGYEDLFISNGHLRDVNDRDSSEQRLAQNRQFSRTDFLLVHPELRPPNAAFRNLGNLRFADVTDLWGFNSTEITHGMALADLDNDGDLDIAAVCANAPPLLYRNDSPAPRVTVRVRGILPNSQAIGARVTLRNGGFDQSQEIISGGRYLSGDDPIRAFAVPHPAEPMSIEVRWPGGRITRLDGIQPNMAYEIHEASAQALPKDSPPEPPAPLFADASIRLSHVHEEHAFDDFSLQPLLPKKLSQLGPGIAWFDIDGNGFEDLIVGAGKGGHIALFKNSAGEFTRAAPASTALPDDSTGILGWVRDGTPVLLAGMAQYERLVRVSDPVLEVGGTTLAPLNGLERLPCSIGPIAMADVDGDGDLDLFIGGRFAPGQYPAPVSSQLYRFHGGAFVRDTEVSGKLEKAGMVSAAIFTDLNNDGFPELVLACEWGPIRVFANERGQFTEITATLGLDAHSGLWTSVTAGDFDGDGLMDLVAGNWGFNSYHQRASNGPWLLYYGHPSGDAPFSLLEAYRHPRSGLALPFRDMSLLSTAFPWFKALAGSHERFATMTAEQLLQPHAGKFASVQTTTLASTIFWNRGGSLEPEPLPEPCQWTPLFGLNVADFNGDGFEDLFVAQNFFSTRPDDDRLSAGRGLLLAGSSSGRLTPVPAQKSGLLIYGEQRGSAAADFDGDGRVDLAVTQNGEATRLFRNVSSPPGVRVRLRGPPDNPRGIGAILRLRRGDWTGPAREIRSGNGYWSQDGAVQVLHGAEGSDLMVRWPGGNETHARIPAQASEITVDADSAQHPVDHSRHSSDSG